MASWIVQIWHNINICLRWLRVLREEPVDIFMLLKYNCVLKSERVTYLQRRSGYVDWLWNISIMDRCWREWHSAEILVDYDLDHWRVFEIVRFMRRHPGQMTAIICRWRRFDAVISSGWRQLINFFNCLLQLIASCLKDHRTSVLCSSVTDCWKSEKFASLPYHDAYKDFKYSVKR